MSTVKDVYELIMNLIKKVFEYQKKKPKNASPGGAKSK